MDGWQMEQAQLDEAVQLSLALAASQTSFEREQHYRTEFLVCVFCRQGAFVLHV